jgi:hypothetical protein
MELDYDLKDALRRSAAYRFAALCLASGKCESTEIIGQ